MSAELCTWRNWQKILNEQPVPQPCPPDRDPIAVQARIVWEQDGEEWVDGEAVRWTRDVVYVRVKDGRCSTLGPWLAPTDVRRR